MMMIFLTLAASVAQAPDCANAVTTQELNECASAEYEKADQALNAAWREALAVVRSQDKDDIPPGDTRPKGEAKLREAQRAWITYRDAHCVVQGYQARGGTAETLINLGCLTSATEQRTKELQALYEDR
ncbi:lysozyme inhibitor LprI family protein [Allosphingosinicella vermicomposti]|uniref:lysozyme inhibitor LprI family protein n=1 Tax=Allosphingosinicella vermicomposti TaxID=614671 RepID=UPI000D1133F4|nr:lysozyme inhibitor LprI family protein [Allosphingosinicella vermicomposti]